MRTLIDKTGQEWKEHLAFFGFFAFLCLAWPLEGHVKILHIVILEGIALALSIFSVISIRCPNCSMRWLWHELSNYLKTLKESGLPSEEQCPECGFRPEGKV